MVSRVFLLISNKEFISCFCFYYEIRSWYRMQRTRERTRSGSSVIDTSSVRIPDISIIQIWLAFRYVTHYIYEGYRH